MLSGTHILLGSNKSQIEREQRKFLSFAAYLLKIDQEPHDHEPVLKSLGLQTLVDRRVIANNEEVVSQLQNSQINKINF